MNYEYESSSKIPLFLSITKQIWFLLTKSHFFFFLIFYKTDLIFINQIPFFYFLIFFILDKTNLIFINQIPFFFPLQNRSDIFVNQISFFSTLQNRFDFSLRRGHIHKTNFFKLILSSKMFVTCITTYHTKGYIMVIRV